MLDRLVDIQARTAYGLLIPLGARDDLIGLLRSLLKKRLGSRGVHTVTLSVGTQTTRIRPSYALYVPHSADAQATAHVI